MKIKISLISMILILVLCIGAVSAADIDDATDSDSDISISSPVDLNVENDGSDYVSDDIGTNDSDSSLLGVSGDEDLIGDGEIAGFEFKDAVDGVITFYEAKDWNGNPGNWESYGYQYNNVYVRAFDENNNTIELNEENFDFEFDGWARDEGYKDFNPFSNKKDGYQGSMFTNLPGICRNDDGEYLDEVVDFKIGTYEFVIYNADKSVSKSVTFKLIEPKKIEATYSIGDIITLNITTNDGPGNFTVYLDNESIATGSVNDDGNSSVTFEKRLGAHDLKVILDGATISGLIWEDDIFIPSPGMFSDLNSMITNNDVVNLSYNIVLDPYEVNLLKDGIVINKNVTINGNGYTINGTDLVRIFNIGNNANVILKDLVITGALTTSGHGGAIYLGSGNLTVENCTFVGNTLRNNEAHGGAIHAAARTTLTIKDSVFENNTDVPKDGNWRYWSPTTQYAGAIYAADYVNLNISNTVFRGNKAITNGLEGRQSRGGAIVSTGSNSNNNIVNCTFIDNTATNGIGAIQTRNANITGSVFEGNTANNDWPTIYVEGNAKGTISYNVFLDNDTAQIRLRNSYSNMVEEYNWYASNNPTNMVRLENTLTNPNKFIMLDVYNEGNIIKAGFMKDSNRDDIPDAGALPLRNITLTGDVNETAPKLVNGIATVEYTSEITSESSISATIDGYTVNYNIALGNITSIDVIYVENTTVGENGTIIIYLLGDNGAVEGSLNIYLNESKFNVNVIKGVATLKAGSNIDGGIYDIYYEYAGGQNYAATLNKVKSDSTFEVKKRDAEISYSIDYDTGYITIKVLDDEFAPTGNIYMTIDNGSRNTYGVSLMTSLPNTLKNGTHELNLTYSGDKKHNPATVIDSFEILKYTPTCNITQDGGKFTFNFTNENGIPSGRVNVDFTGPNTFSENLWSVGSDGISTYDASSRLQNGSYTLTVHFTSYSFKFESADFTYSFNVSKQNILNMTVNPEIPTKPFQTSSTFEVTVKGAEDGPIPTGSVSYSISWRTFSASLDENGTAKLTWENFGDDIGSVVRTITYNGDINYDSYSMDVTFVCEPQPLTVDLKTNGNNVTLSFYDRAGYNSGTVHIIDNGVYLGNVTGDWEFPEFEANNLELGPHTFEIIWENNNGKNYTSTKTTFLRISGTPQWANTGFDIKNGGNANYTRLYDNVYVVWSNNESINITKYPNNIRREYTGEISAVVYGGFASYSPIIASDGVIYLNDGYTIYVYDSEGNVLYTRSPGRIVPGITIYNDTIILATRTDEEIIAYDFFGGQGYGTETNWVSSSLYYPIVGPDGRIYISGYFNNMANAGNWITVLKYGLWGGNSFSWETAYISSKPIATPVFDDDGNMWVATVDGLRAINVYSESNVFSDNIGINARPVISEANIVYYLGTDNTLYALTGEGYLWNTTFNGTVGSALAIDNENGFVYTVNKEGILYKFDTNDNGALSEVYNLGANARSIIVDGDSKVYVGDENGAVTAFDSEGTLLWSINLGSSIAGGLAMNKDGIIYAYTNDTLFALGYRDPISIEVNIPEGNYSVLDNVTITATLNETTEGNVIFTIGDQNISVAINGTVAELTTTVPGGNQTIVATFEGNDAYVPVAGNATVDIAKLDVEFENVPEIVMGNCGKTISFEFNINYNNTLVKTGSISIYEGENRPDASARFRNDVWRAWIYTWDLVPGEYEYTFVYDGGTTYNSINTTLKVIVLPNVVANAKVVDDKIIVDIIITANEVDEWTQFDECEPIEDATGKFTISANNETVANGTIENGMASVSFDKLEPGTYEIKVIYDGNENIPANNGTTILKIPRTSQWPSVGGNPQNSGIADATREDGVSIIWEAALNGDLRSSAIIDGLGNIYVNDGSKIYAFTSNGTLIWSGGPGSAGIALYKDEIILSPIYHYNMQLINATNGNNLGGNYWSASSAFTPITGPDGRIYTPTDYGYPADGQGWSGNYWVSVFDETGYEWEPYGFNLFLVEITGVEYGSQALKASPSFDSLGYIYANTVKGFKIINIATGATVFSDTSINGVGRPVIDSNNIAYILDATLNGIYAISTEGILWNATVSDAIGTTLAVDNENGFLYAVNANGTLYKYDTADGCESLVYELNSTGVSIILDADSNVYVSTAAGDVVAISADGELLWTINLGSKVVGQLAMDNNGIIYAAADKTLYALGFDANMDVAGENVTVFDNEIITVTIDAEGNVTFSFNGEDTEVPIENGTATLDLGQLPAGTYTVSVTYDGDGIAYGPAFAETAFEITKVDAEITEEIVASVENSTLTLTLPEAATGIVLAKVDGKGYYAEVENGTAVIEIPEMAPGKYPVDITYLGDDNYNNASFTTELEVPELLDAELEADVNETLITVNINENATGKVIVTVANASYIKDASEAPITIDVADLPAGTYDVTVEYLGDENFLDDVVNTTVTVPEVIPEDANVTVDVNDTEVSVELPEDATGYVVVSVNGTDYFFDAGDDIALDLSDLTPGEYPVEITYSGDDKYAPATANTTVTVPEVLPEEANVTVAVNDSEVNVELPEDATGYVVVSVNGTDYFFDAGDDIALDLSDLAPGEYPVEITYSGDDKYAPATANTTVTVPEVVPEDANVTVDVNDSDVSVALPEDAEGYVVVSVGDKKYYFDADDEIELDLSDLAPGEYPVEITYSGDDKYAPATANTTVTVPEVVPEDANLTATAQNTTITVTVAENATGNVLVDVNGTGYFAPIENGQATVEVIGLDEGTYDAVVTYEGDDTYAPANATVAVTVPAAPKNETDVDPEANVTASEDAIEIELPEDATGYMLVDVDGTGYYVPVENGKATFELPELAPGNHTVGVIYTGDKKYASANSTETIEVPLPDETIFAEDLVKVEKAGDRFVANFTDSEGNPLANANVTFEINGGVYTRTTDANGQASIAINLATGNYTITTTNPATGDVKVNNITVLSRFTEDSDLVKYFRNDSQYVLRVLGDDGNPVGAGEIVTYNINGVFYNRTTNATGHVQLNINLGPGTYIITAEYKGAKVAHNVTVLPVLTAENLSKKFGEANPFEAHVYDGQGKPAAEQDVEVNINGVFYHRTSDSNGLARLNINLGPGEYIITSTYGAAAISNTVTVTA